jgi:hypothetical protein
MVRSTQGREENQLDLWVGHNPTDHCRLFSEDLSGFGYINRSWIQGDLN